jgi:hypothetical protein
MASQVLSGATNASYTNNTGQNVRLIINYMANVTSMTWAGVNVTAESTTIGKDIQNITGEFRSAELGTKVFDNSNITGGGSSTLPPLYTVWELKLGNKKPFWYQWKYLESVATGPTYNATSISGSGSNPYYPIASTNFRTFNTTDKPPAALSTRSINPGDQSETAGGNFFYVPLTVSRGGNFPVELMLAQNQSFSAVCGAYNAIVIKEDGT